MGALDFAKSEYCDDLDTPLGGLSLTFEGDAVELMSEIRHDADLEAIREVEIWQTSSDRIDFRHLAALPHLESVRLYDCALVDNGPSLRQLPRRFLISCSIVALGPSNWNI